MKQFWDTVDKDLEVQKAKARIKAMMPASHRSPPTAMLGALMDALEADPYKKL